MDRSEDQRLSELLARERPRRIVVVTGAGISAESGIPTYRGEDDARSFALLTTADGRPTRPHARACGCAAPRRPGCPSS